MTKKQKEALKALEDAADKCVERYGFICSDGYHDFSIGMLIAACHREGCEPKDMQAIFKDRPLEWD